MLRQEELWAWIQLMLIVAASHDQTSMPSWAFGVFGFVAKTCPNSILLELRYLRRYLPILSKILRPLSAPSMLMGRSH